MNPKNTVTVVQKLGANVDTLQLFQTVVASVKLFVDEAQSAATERTAIGAWEDVQLSKINAQREVLLKALDLTFDERRENFHRLFDGLDTALAAGDPTQATQFLGAITDLARESPFKDIANLEIIVAELKRPDHVWEV